jgi:hypothetical protein
MRRKTIERAASMEKEFRFEREYKSGGTRIALSGVIDERARLESVFHGLEDGAVILNLREVTRINSCGVRDWLNAVKQIAKTHEIFYEQCSRAIIDQMNMITSFADSAAVKSFVSPYYCGKCEKQHEILIEVENLQRANLPEAPEALCPDCGAEMEFSEIEEKYFHFLSR